MANKEVTPGVNLVRAENLSKEYPGGSGPVPVVKGVSFTAGAGELIGVAGPSGSGKSTLLSILGGLNPPTAGRVVVDDIDVYGLPPDRRADFRNQYLGFVFQEWQLIPYLTALQNVMLPLVIGTLGPRRQREMAEQALARVGLAGKHSRLPSHLSGGEQERVAIARAVVNEPALLLADEPTGALDSRTGREIMELFAGLARDGRCVIMVTHNRENLEYASRVFTMRDGVLSPQAALGDRNGAPSDS